MGGGCCIRFGRGMMSRGGDCSVERELVREE